MKQARTLSLAIVVVVLVLALGIIYAVQNATHRSPIMDANTSVVKASSTHDLVQLLAKTGIQLPSAQDPVVAKIKDVESLRTVNPSFYAGAQNDDLIYVWTDHVILYSMSKHKVLQNMPIVK